jgi:hypothetical protein
MLVNLTAVNQMDPYDSDSSDGGPEFPSQSLSFNDSDYKTYKRGQQFMIVDHTANQRNGLEVSRIWYTAESAVESTMADDFPTLF